MITNLIGKMPHLTPPGDRANITLGKVLSGPASLAHPYLTPYLQQKCFFSFYIWESLWYLAQASPTHRFSFFSLLTLWITCLASITFENLSWLALFIFMWGNEGGTTIWWASVWTKDNHDGGDTIGEVPNSEGREKTPREVAGRVSWDIGSGEAVYTMVRKWSFWARWPSLNPCPPLPFLGIGQIPPSLLCLSFSPVKWEWQQYLLHRLSKRITWVSAWKVFRSRLGTICGHWGSKRDTFLVIILFVLIDRNCYTMFLRTQKMVISSSSNDNK